MFCRDLRRQTRLGGGRDRRRLQIADLISKLRAKIIAVVRGATFLINARSTATLEWRRRGEERRRKGRRVWEGLPVLCTNLNDALRCAFCLSPAEWLEECACDRLGVFSSARVIQSQECVKSVFPTLRNFQRFLDAAANMQAEPLQPRGNNGRVSRTSWAINNSTGSV